MSKLVTMALSYEEVVALETRAFNEIIEVIEYENNQEYAIDLGGVPEYHLKNLEAREEYWADLADTLYHTLDRSVSGWRHKPYLVEGVLEDEAAYIRTLYGKGE